MNIITSFPNSTLGLRRKFAVLFCVSGLVACGGGVIENDNQEPDPVAVDVPVAYILRDLQVSEGEPVRSLTEPSEFLPGAQLLIKPRAYASAVPVNISSRLFPDALDEEGNPLPFDIKDLKADYSGNRLIFAVRAPELPNMNEEPTWNIWQYDRSTDELTRIIQSDIVAEAGNDTGPVYLADGRIVFSSTRQRGNQARLLDEGKPQYSGLEEGLDVQASVLHIMDADGENIRQISFNQSHDLDPLVLPNGKVLFSRWDQAGGNKGLNLYQINPDGSDLEILYGRHSHDVVAGLNDVQYTKARVTPEGQVLLGINSFSSPLFGTDFVTIDIENYTDFSQPIDGANGAQDTAQQSALFDAIQLNGDISPQGFINALYPLWDGSGRILFSWSQCRLYQPLPEGADPNSPRVIAPCSDENIANPEFEQAPFVYGLWMFDPAEGTQLSLELPETDFVVSEVLAMESKPFPSNPDSTIDRSRNDLIDAGVGILHIKSVYDFDGEDTSPFGITNMSDPTQVSADQRPARFLRVTKSVSIPDEDTFEFDNSAFGRSRNQLMREIVGYTPIQPDGSVEVAIPANIPFAISIVDADGKRISNRHNNWLQVAPGEIKQCIGCHTPDSTAPHGRLDAQPPSINAGAATTGSPFPGTNPELFADLGETMAQTLSRLRGLPQLSPNIEFTDIWVDPDTTAPTEDFLYAYADLQTALPITQACAQNWTSICRSVINFPDHIAPIFSVDRRVFDDMENLIEDRTCLSCHSPTDADEMVRVPEAQLDLSMTPSPENADLLVAYRELLFNDNEQEVIDGALLDRRVLVFDNNGDPVFERDEDGELILDAEGNPIQVTQLVGVPASMNVNGARNSGRFFAQFESGSHQGWLTEAELKLMAEWLDIGAQYYNNPFDAPED